MLSKCYKNTAVGIFTPMLVLSLVSCGNTSEHKNDCDTVAESNGAIDKVSGGLASKACEAKKTKTVLLENNPNIEHELDVGIRSAIRASKVLENNDVDSSSEKSKKMINNVTNKLQDVLNQIRAAEKK